MKRLRVVLLKGKKKEKSEERPTFERSSGLSGGTISYKSVV